MLNDPLLVAIQSASLSTFDGGSASLSLSTVVPFRGLGGSVVGSSVRENSSVLGSKAKLSISHSLSKENAPYDTDRSLVRLDLQRVDANGKSVNMAVYVVVALPQGGLFSSADCKQAINTLLSLLVFGPVDPVTGSLPLSAANDLMSRVIEGEP